MGKLLTILGVKDQTNLPPEIFVAENLIIGMQFIYENSPESPKKATLAKTIAETIRLTLQQIKGLPLTPPTKPIETPKTSVPRVLTEAEMEGIYGADWREAIADDDKVMGLDWVSPYMDKWLGVELTEAYIKEIEKEGMFTPTDQDGDFAISKVMTTLNPKFKQQETQPKPQEQTQGIRVLTEQEFIDIYDYDGESWIGDIWREEVGKDANEQGLTPLEWVSPEMDVMFGKPLREKQVKELKEKGETPGIELMLGRLMTTLNPKYVPATPSDLYKVGDRFIGGKDDEIYEIIEITAKSVRYELVEDKTTVSWRLRADFDGFLANNNWKLIKEQRLNFNVGDVFKIKGKKEKPNEFKIDKIDKQQGVVWVTWTNERGLTDTTDYSIEQVVSLFDSGEWIKINDAPKDELPFKVGDVFRHNTEKNHSPWTITEIDKSKDRVEVAWDNKTTDYSLAFVIDVIKKGIWVKVNNDDDVIETENLPKYLALGEKMEVMDANSIDYYKHFHWGAKTEKEYNDVLRRLKSLEYKGDGWRVYLHCDYSSFDYWMIKQREQNYINISLYLPNESVKRSEIENINRAISDAISEAEIIAEKYNYDPSQENNEVGYEYKVGDIFKTSVDEVWKITKITNSNVEYEREDGTNRQTTLSRKKADEFFNSGSWIIISNVDVLGIGDWVWFEGVLGKITKDNGDDTFTIQKADKARYDEVEKAYINRYATSKEIDDAIAKEKERLNKNKKSERPSPTMSANDVKAGTKMVGNDGNMYIAKKTKAGYNQWKKV